jgi:hypothetical protein
VGLNTRKQLRVFCLCENPYARQRQEDDYGHVAIVYNTGKTCNEASLIRVAAVEIIVGAHDQSDIVTAIRKSGMG